MLTCDAAHRLIAPAADGGPFDSQLDEHLAACAACREVFADQQLVLRTLQGREPDHVPAGFAARVSARLDEEGVHGGMLDLIDWRAWTVGLAPLAAALVVAAYLGVGAGQPPETVLDSTAAMSASTEPTFESWATSAATDTPASVFLQPAVSAELLLETVLTGAVPAWSSPGDADVR